MTVKEYPHGSGIHGRPVLKDNLKHVAYYRAGHWHTWCGQPVPEDHRCPAGASSDWRVKNCADCHTKYLVGR